MQDRQEGTRGYNQRWPGFPPRVTTLAGWPCDLSVLVNSPIITIPYLYELGERLNRLHPQPAAVPAISSPPMVTLLPQITNLDATSPCVDWLEGQTEGIRRRYQKGHPDLAPEPNAFHRMLKAGTLARDFAPPARWPVEALCQFYEWLEYATGPRTENRLKNAEAVIQHLGKGTLKIFHPETWLPPIQAHVTPAIRSDPAIWRNCENRPVKVHSPGCGACCNPMRGESEHP